MSFAALKKASKAGVDSIRDKFEQDKGGYAKDERYWTLTVNKEGVGSAVIRFLPEIESENSPFVRLYNYFVKVGKSYYTENCRSTLGKNEADPMNQYFFQIRGDGNDKKRVDAARQFSRNLNYISNIYVVDDPANPENNGKVFLFKYGSRIHQKLEGAITPEFEDEKPFNPFDLWSGANFRLKARMLDNQRSYDKSHFDECGPLFEDDEKMEAVWKKCYPLLPEISPDKFKSYDELKEIVLKFIKRNDLEPFEEDEDEKPVRKSRPVKDEDEDEKPVRKSRPVKDEDEDEKPVRKSRQEKDEDETPPWVEADDEKPSRKSSQKKDEDEDEKPVRKSSKEDSEDDTNDEFEKYRRMLEDD